MLFLLTSDGSGSNLGFNKKGKKSIYMERVCSNSSCFEGATSEFLSQLQAHLICEFSYEQVLMMQEEGVKDTFHRFYTNENVKVGYLDLLCL